MYFSIKKKKNLTLVFFIILTSIYFKAKTAVLYQTNTYKKLKPNYLMFIKPRGVLWPKLKLILRKNWLSKSGLKKLVGWIVKGPSLRPRKLLKKPDDFMFFVLLGNTNFRVFRGYFQCTFSWIWEHIFLTVFINLNFYFGFLAQKSCIRETKNLSRIVAPIIT